MILYFLSSVFISYAYALLIDIIYIILFLQLLLFYQYYSYNYSIFIAEDHSLSLPPQADATAAYLLSSAAYHNHRAI